MRKLLLILILGCFILIASQNKIEFIFFEFIEKFDPLVAKYLHIEADFLRVLQKLHILTPAEVCKKCQEHYAEKKKKYQTEDTKFIKDLYKEMEKICEKKVDKILCEGVIKNWAPAFIHNYLSHFFDPDYQCGSQGFCSNYKELSFDEYKTRVLADMPTPQKTPVMNINRYKILHLTDTHTEFEYTEGTEANCTSYFCCLKDDGPAKSNATAAGKWGTNKGSCDLPAQTLEESLKYIAEVIKPEIVLWTGDSFGHILWKQSKEKQLEALKYNSKLIEEYLIKKGIIVYPMWGNHESFPLDQFDFYGNQTQYLKDGAYEAWKNWLPKEAIESLQKKGSYSIKNEKFKFKLITLLTEVFDTLNFNLLQFPTNPMNELDWIESELREAEKTGYTVIIQGHIPIGDLTSQTQWSKRYSVLFERFQNIIRGQFFGHTHFDQFQLITTQDSHNKAIGVTYTSPCFTGGKTIPSFREYEFDRDTNALLNIITYRLELEKANTDNAINLMNYWHKAYDFVSYYNLKDYITIDQMIQLVNSLQKDKTLLRKYLYNYYQAHTSLDEIDKKLVDDKKGDYQKLRYCEASSTVFGDIFHCAKDSVTTERSFEFLEYLQDLSKVWYEIKKIAKN